MRPLTLLVVAAGIAACASSAEAAMYKCVTRDGTVLFQARPCAASDKEVDVSGSVAPAEAANGSTEPTRRKVADSDPRLQALRTPRDTEERAVMDRDLAQRRDRCRSAREIVERAQSSLESPNEVTRQQAGNEIKIQQRRMREDRCDAL